MQTTQSTIGSYTAISAGCVAIIIGVVMLSSEDFVLGAVVLLIGMAIAFGTFFKSFLK